MSAPEPSSTWVEVPMTPTGRRYYVNLHTQETAWAIPDGAVVVPAKLVTSPKAEPSAPTRPMGDATTIKEGWLEKTNKKGKHWKKRWIVGNLATKTLSYYGENPHKTLYLYDVVEAAKGSIDLSHATVSMATPVECAKAPSPFCVMIRTAERETVLAARDEETRDSWVAFLQMCGTDTFSSSMTPVSRIHAMKPRPGAEPHTLTGDLVKACGDGRVWKPRHVTLRPDLRVAVYAKPGHVTEASGVIDLRAATLRVGLTDSTLRDVPVFQISAQGRMFVFRCHDVETLQRWLDAIQAIIDMPAVVLPAGKVKLEGQLTKSNKSGMYWKKRWFCLNEGMNSLVYYADSAKTVAKGVIRLSGAKIRFGDGEVKYPTRFPIVIVSDGRSFYIAAESVEEQVSWIDSLATRPDVVSGLAAYS